MKYDIIHDTAGKIGDATIHIEGDTAHIANIKAGEGITGEPNALGPGSMRSLMRQFLNDNPEVKSFTGARISGARAGGEYGGGGGDVKISAGKVSGMLGGKGGGGFLGDIDELGQPVTKLGLGTRRPARID